MYTALHLKNKPMKTLILLFIAVAFISCSDDSPTPFVDQPTHAQAKRLTRLYITIGANNAFGINTPISEQLTAKYPADNLYFVHHAVSGTNLYGSWHPKQTVLSRFREACIKVDQALATMPAPDEVNVIWVQGEADAKINLWSKAYLTNELMLEDSLRSRYAPLRKNGRAGKVKWKFINYQPVGTYSYLSTVLQAKAEHAELRNNILISVPATEEYYTEGTYLTPAGINKFADLVVDQL
jgi:hypothetical protein